MGWYNFLFDLFLAAISGDLMGHGSLHNQTTFWTLVATSFLQAVHHCNFQRQTTSATVSSAKGRRHTGRGGGSGPKSGRSSQYRNQCILTTFVSYVLVIMNTVTMSGGEGYGFEPCEPMGVAFDSQTIHQLMTTKIHGHSPPNGSGHLKSLTSQHLSNVQKRSFRRACTRAHRDGMAWYKGKCLMPHDFPAHILSQAPSRRDRTGIQNRQPHRHAPTDRLNIVHFNVGGLSSFRFAELKQWAAGIECDICILTETRWSFSSEWRDNSWSCIHSGTQDKADGILVMINKSVCNDTQIGISTAIEGRLLHIRIHFDRRALDLICCYQHADDHTASRKQLRRHFWQQLDRRLAMLPNRNMFLLAGDLNCSVHSDGRHVGMSTFRWYDTYTAGPQHADMAELQQLLRKYDLSVTSSWNSQNGPSFQHGFHASRIDHFIMRCSEADGTAKDVVYMARADILPLKGAHHIPMLCKIKRIRFSYKVHDGITGVSFQQRLQCRHDWSRQNERWQELMTDSNEALANCPVCPAPKEEVLHDFHNLMLPIFHQHYPSRATTTAQRTVDVASDMTHWAYRRLVQRNLSTALPALFQVWANWTKYHILKKCHAKSMMLKRKEEFALLLTSVQTAALNHDSFRMHHIISQYTPKQVKRKIRLRMPNGDPASPMEVKQLICDHVRKIWAGPMLIHYSIPQDFCIPFSFDDLLFELQHIPHNKSVAKPFTPGILIKQHAQRLAPWLYDLVTKWWTPFEIYIPMIWKRAWITFLPKSQKTPDTLANLRPIALQEPLGKCVLGALVRVLQRDLAPILMPWPQYAFLPFRSASDAIRRVAFHCQTVRTLIQNQRRTIHQRASNQQFHMFCGGIQLLVDLRQAFDCVDRNTLFQHLSTLNINSSVIAILTEWHSNTSYAVHHDREELVIPTGRGVRQGCRAAPMLWNGLMHRCLQSLSEQTSETWVQQCLTLFADDFHAGDIFTDQEGLHRILRCFGVLLDTLADLGLDVSLEKSHLLVAMAGSQSRSLRPKFVQTGRNGPYMMIPRRNGHASALPVKTSADYLGVKISYQQLERQTFERRLHSANFAFHRLRKWLQTKKISLRYRLQLWRASVVATLHYGLIAVNLTLPILSRYSTLIMSMYRRILGNHSFRTHDSNTRILSEHHLDHPLHLLLRHAHQCAATQSHRLTQVDSMDTIRTIDWHTIQQNIQLIHTAMAVQHQVMPTPGTAAEVPITPTYVCSYCAFRCDSLPNLRRHLTTAHGDTQFRTSICHAAAHAVNGLPQCSTCYMAFTTWRSFQIHLERKCCEASTRPTADSDGDAVPPVQASSQARLTRAHMENLLMKAFGHDLIEIIRHRDWFQLAQSHVACDYMKQHCVLCGLFQGRAQDLHHHLRTVHGSLMDHVFTKAAQLCRAQASISPCRFCTRAFKTSHMCAVMTQAAMLMINLYAEGSAESNVPAMVRTCDICHQCFPDLATLLGHLSNDHKLALQDWRPERDLLGKDPVCAHCMKCFQDKAAVRQHVTQGQCTAFDPTKQPYDIPVAQHWSELIRTGDIAALKSRPSDKQRLTLTCQTCGLGFDRQMDLSLHLQSVHADHWQRAQATTQMLIKHCFASLGCLCNPVTNGRSVSHVCPMYRQLAMLHIRTEVPLFLPWQIDAGSMQVWLSHMRFHPILQQLIHCLHTRQFDALFTNIEFHQLLRHTCVICGGAFHPAALTVHLHRAHSDDAAGVPDIVSQLLDNYIHGMCNDYTCHLCNAVFNLPGTPEDTMTQRADRGRLAQIHLQHQCPVLLQTGILLCHGRHRSSNHHPGAEQGTPCRLGGNGTPGDQGHSSKRRRTRAQESQKGTSQATEGGSDGPESTAASHGHHDPTTRPGQPGNEKTRLLRMLFAERSPGHPSASGPDGEAMAPPNVSEREGHVRCFDLCATTGDTDDDTGPIGTAPITEAQSMHPTGRHVPISGPTPHVEPGWVLSISSMERARPEADGDGSEAHPYGQNASLHLPAERHSPGCIQRAEVPRLESPGDGVDSTVAATSGNSPRRAARSAEHTGGQQGMVPDRNVAEAPLFAAERPSDETPGPDGQGREEGQRQGQTVQVTNVYMDRTSLCLAVSRLMLTNIANDCFSNTAFLSTLWAMINRFDFQLSDLGPHATEIVRFVHDTNDRPCDLMHQSWFTALMQHWHNPGQQGDPVEFLTFMLTGLQFTGLDMSWERRLQIGVDIHCHDKNGRYQPVVLQFDENLMQAETLALRHMMYSWTNSLGMQAAMLSDTTLICLHIDRFCDQGNGTLGKCSTPVGLHGGVEVPFFAGTDLGVIWRDFQVISAISHLGQDEAGHCRSLLKTWPDSLSSAEPCLFLLTDDDREPQRVWHEPQWFAANVSCVWICDCTWLDLLRLPPSNVSDAGQQTGAIVPSDLLHMLAT